MRTNQIAVNRLLQLSVFYNSYYILNHTVILCTLIYIFCDIFLEIKNDLQKIIVDAFSLFTHDNINIISITDLGKAIRHLGTYIIYKAN